MPIDYTNLRLSLKNLETQHQHLLNLPADYPAFVHEGMDESVIQPIQEICYDTLWKTLRRYLVEGFGPGRGSQQPKAHISDCRREPSAGVRRRAVGVVRANAH